MAANKSPPTLNEFYEIPNKLNIYCLLVGHRWCFVIGRGENGEPGEKCCDNCNLIEFDYTYPCRCSHGCVCEHPTFNYGEV